jgi:hypothetical protein
MVPCGSIDCAAGWVLCPPLEAVILLVGVMFLPLGLFLPCQAGAAESCRCGAAPAAHHLCMQSHWRLESGRLCSFGRRLRPRGVRRTGS